MTTEASSRSPVSDFPQTRLCEADLSHIWEGQTFPPEALTARDGTRLRVIYRGRRSHGPGPDFRDAIIAAPYGLLEGDVELHLRSSDFRRHGHHLDAAYDNVALHLVLKDDDGAATRLACGRRVPTVALGDWLERRAGIIQTWLDSTERWQEPCRSSLGRLGREEVGRTLDRLGDMRFRALAASFRKQLNTVEPDGLFWEGVLDALGYGGHRQRFRALAAALPWPALQPLLTAPAHETRRRVALRALHAADAGPELSPGGSLRPANRFSRRLEGAAALAARYPHGFTGAATTLLALEGRDAVREVIRRFTVPNSLGRSRAVEIAANVALPLLAALDGDRHERAAERLYALLPLPARYGSVRHLHEAVGGNSVPGVPVNARRQQGMLYLFKQYCTQGGCGRCPLS